MNPSSNQPNATPEQKSSTPDIKLGTEHQNAQEKGEADKTNAPADANKKS